MKRLSICVHLSPIYEYTRPGHLNGLCFHFGDEWILFRYISSFNRSVTIEMSLNTRRWSVLNTYTRFSINAGCTIWYLSLLLRCAFRRKSMEDTLPYIIITHELLCTLMANVHAFSLDRQCADNVHRLLLI